MTLTNSGLIALALHTIVILFVIGAIVALAWHNSIDGSAALVAILAASGIQVAGAHGITSTLRAAAFAAPETGGGHTQ